MGSFCRSLFLVARRVCHGGLPSAAQRRICHSERFHFSREHESGFRRGRGRCFQTAYGYPHEQLLGYGDDRRRHVLRPLVSSYSAGDAVQSGSRPECRPTVSFTPHAAGKPVGRLTISTSAATAGTIAITASGSAVAPGALELSPASLSFGTVVVGQSEAQTATLKNSGSSSVTVWKASVSSAAFTISGLALPVTLAAGQSTTITVTFAPKTSGWASGSVAISGTASLTLSASSGSSDLPPHPRALHCLWLETAPPPDNWPFLRRA